MLQNKVHKVLKSGMSLMLSGVLFGTVTGAAFYGVNTVLTGTDTNIQSSVSSSNISYTKTSSQTQDVSTIAKNNLSSIVAITNISVSEVQDYFGRYQRGGYSHLEETTSCDSGIIYQSLDSELYIVTNYHVVEGASTLSVTFVNDETYEATFCGYDETYDLAVIKVSTSDLSEDAKSSITIATIGSSDELAVGEQVVAIGNALGYGQSVTTGIVSALNRSVEDENSQSLEYIQTDASINPGNSGGALLNMNGEVIGINTAKISTTGVEGMGYAIPISDVTDIIQSLINR